MSNYRRIQDRSRYRKSFFFVTEGAASEEAYLKIVWNRLGLREYCNARFCHEKSSIPAMLATAKKVEKTAHSIPAKEMNYGLFLITMSNAISRNNLRS